MSTAPLSVADVISPWVEASPDTIAIRTRTEQLTYQELDARANRVAHLLLSRGLAPDSRVGYIGRNRIDYWPLILGAQRAGMVPVPLNWRLTVHELAGVAADARLALLFGDDEYAALAPAVIPWGGAPDQFGGLVDAQPASPPEVSRSPEATAWILFTSGTTGKPKGAVVTHANVLANLYPWGEVWGIDQGSVIWNPYPSFHNTFLGVSLVILSRGGTVELRDAVDVEDLLWSIEHRGVSFVLMVPAVLQQVLEARETTSRDLSSLTRVVTGTAPVSPRLLARFLDAFPGCWISNNYGATETTTSNTNVTFRHPSELTESRVNSVGEPLPWIELRIADPVTLEEVATGADGEIWVRSPSCVRQYFEWPEATAKTFTPDGWVRTSDVGHLDHEGLLHITDRLNDLIISGSENISPTEVEESLRGFDEIRDVSVVGVADERWGEVPFAFIVPADVGVDATALRDYCAAHLATFKTPVGFRVIDELPRNATGKVLRTRLRERLRDDPPSVTDRAIRQAP